MNRLIALIIIALLLSPAVNAQQVFGDVYDHDIFGNHITFTGPNKDLLVGGQKRYFRPVTNLNKSDFGLLRTNPDGSPVLTKVYHFLAEDKVEYVANIDTGYVMAGVSKPRPNDALHSAVVIARTNLRGQVLWSKAFYPRNGRGIMVGGMVVNDHGEIIFTAQVFRAPATSVTDRNIHGLVIKLDGRGNVLWTRTLSLGTAYGVRGIPRSNVAIADSGFVVTGWQFGAANSRTRRGIAFVAFKPGGRLLYSRAYRANGLLSMTCSPRTHSIAAYARDTMNHTGFMNLNLRGKIRYGFLDNLQRVGNVAPQVAMKSDNGRFPYSYNNTLTLHSPLTTAASLQMAAVKTQTPARQHDFITDGRQVYITGSVYYPPNDRAYPVLLKTAFANFDNCFTKFSRTQIRGRFKTRPIRADLIPTAVPVIAIQDSAINLRTATIAAHDSVFCKGTGLVWPGDANSDGFVEVKDLLAIGMAWGSSGPARPNASVNWVGQPARNWGQTFINDADYKHADCNGNGHIGIRDAAVVVLNAGNTHNKGMVNGTTADAPLFVSFPQDGLNGGEKVEIPVYLGDAQLQINDIHGLTFSLMFDPATVGEDITFRPTASWLGTPGTDLVSIEKGFYQDGLLDVALTRIDQQDVRGHGKIGVITFTTKRGSEAGTRPFFFEINNTYALNTYGDEYLLNGKAEVTELHTRADRTPSQLRPQGLAREAARTQMFLSPNPAADRVRIQTDGEALSRIEVTDLYGRMLMARTVAGNDLTLSLSDLPEGIYLLKGYANGEIVTRRIRVAK